MCVYNVLYISIGIYKISTAKKIENHQEERTSHIVKAKSRAEPPRRERTSQETRGHTPGNAQHNTPPTVEPC